ncbi:hypothetical protein J2W80_003079 [Methylorubrum extorquens]|nr:hypothetical protein [Methylorubrum extorquens]MCP1589387.1 hypothetical protein [Methylorubrum extorquens]
MSVTAGQTAERSVKPSRWPGGRPILVNVRPA